MDGLLVELALNGNPPRVPEPYGPLCPKKENRKDFLKQKSRKAEKGIKWWKWSNSGTVTYDEVSSQLLLNKEINLLIDIGNSFFVWAYCDSIYIPKFSGSFFSLYSKSHVLLLLCTSQIWFNTMYLLWLKNIPILLLNNVLNMVHTFQEYQISSFASSN